MSECPKVSICIPSFNHARFLPNALESAISQTYRNIEIIVVDDGSTDDSLAIAESYAQRHPGLIRIFTHPGRRNLGIGATANAAFKKSTGYYWSGLCSDDILYPEKIEVQVAYLNQHPDLAWVYSHAHYIDEQGDLLPGLFGWDISQKTRPVERLILLNSIPAMTVLARRECFAVVGPETENLTYSDWELWIRMAAHYKIGFMTEPLVKYRVHGNNTSVGIDEEENVRRGLEVFNSLAKNCQRYGGRLLEQRTQLLIDLQRVRYLFCLNERPDAAETLRSLFAAYPEFRNNLDLLDEWWKAPHPDPERLPEFFGWTLQELRGVPGNSLSKTIAKRLEGLSLATSAIDSYLSGDLPDARRLIIRAQRTDGRWLYDHELISILTESLVGSPAMKRARQMKRWIASRMPVK